MRSIRPIYTSFIAAICLSVILSPASADTSVYTGRSKTQSTQDALPLAGGSTALGVSATGTAAMVCCGTNIPIIVDVRCNGVGHVLASDQLHELVAYCRLSESQTDAFNLRINEQDGKADVNIIGGIGRWAGATGSGTFERQGTNTGFTDSTFELTITSQ